MSAEDFVSLNYDLSDLISPSSTNFVFNLDSVSVIDADPDEIETSGSAGTNGGQSDSDSNSSNNNYPDFVNEGILNLIDNNFNNDLLGYNDFI